MRERLLPHFEKKPNYKRVLIVSILCSEKPNRIHAFEPGDKKAKIIFFENKVSFVNNIKDKKKVNKFKTL